MARPPAQTVVELSGELNLKLAKQQLGKRAPSYAYVAVVYLLVQGLELGTATPQKQEHTMFGSEDLSLKRSRLASWILCIPHLSKEKKVKIAVDVINATGWLHL